MTHAKTITTIFEKTKLSAMANCAERLTLLMRVVKELRNSNSLFAISIVQGFDKGYPSVMIMDTLKDAIRDNEQAIIKQIGSQLVQEIKCLS